MGLQLFAASYVLFLQAACIGLASVAILRMARMIMNRDCHVGA